MSARRIAAQAAKAAARARARPGALARLGRPTATDAARGDQRRRQRLRLRLRRAGGILASSKLCIFDAATTASTATFNPSALPGNHHRPVRAGRQWPASRLGDAGRPGWDRRLLRPRDWSHAQRRLHDHANRRHEHRRRRNLPDGLHDQRRQRRDGRSSPEHSRLRLVMGPRAKNTPGSSRATSYTSGAGGGTSENSLGSGALGGSTAANEHAAPAVALAHSGLPRTLGEPVSRQRRRRRRWLDQHRRRRWRHEHHRRRLWLGHWRGWRRRLDRIDGDDCAAQWRQWRGRLPDGGRRRRRRRRGRRGYRRQSGRKRRRRRPWRRRRRRRRRLCDRHAGLRRTRRRVVHRNLVALTALLAAAALSARSPAPLAWRQGMPPMCPNGYGRHRVQQHRRRKRRHQCQQRLRPGWDRAIPDQRRSCS